MDAKTHRKKKGGLVLKTKELAQLLNEAGTVGLAFALKSPGKAENVDLDVLRVYEKEGVLYGEKSPIDYKAGAKSPLRHPSGRVEDFRFKFSKKLEEDAFAFGFFSKDSLEQLFSHQTEEVFIGGGKKDYGSSDFFQENKTIWFSLAITIRKSLALKDPTRGGIAFAAPQAEQVEISLAEFVQKGQVDILNLDKKYPELFGPATQVDSLLMDADGFQVSGMSLQNRGKSYAVSFAPDTPVYRVLLNPRGGIQKIDLSDELEDIESGDQRDSKPDKNLGTPMMGHMEPCPPRWYPGKREAALQRAVLDVLNV